jgi:hypothetical protein
MTYQEHGHKGMWSISIALVELSPDIEVLDTVSEIETHDTLGEPHCTVGISEDERRAPH